MKLQNSYKTIVRLAENMKRNTMTLNEILKPILYIIFYLVMLLLLMSSLTSVVNAVKSENYPVKKEINIHKPNTT